MADVDRYEPRGDRGHRGGYGGKKRRLREDDDSYDRRDRPQRRRYEEPTGTRLRKQLLAIAESPLRNAEDEALNIAKITAENWDDQYIKDTFCEISILLVLEQPFKIPFVAACVLHANTQNSEITTEILARAGAKAQGFLETGGWKEVKLLLRFFACLHSLFEDAGVFPILDELFNRAVDLQTASSEDTLGLELVKIILFTIPYIMATSTSESEQQKAAQLLNKTDIVASTPHMLDALVDPYINNEEEENRPMGFQTILTLLQKQLQTEAANEWKLACIPRPYSAVVTSGSDENGDAPTPAKHPFPSITVPTTVKLGPKALFPEIYFSLYADQDIESVPPTSNIAASLIRDTLVDTMNHLDFNRNAVAKFLIEMDCYWAPDTFVKRATPFDKLRAVPENKSTWKPEDLAVDAVFSQLLQLPTPEHKLVYYHSVITESCKIAPAAIAPSLGRAIRFLFRNVDAMDMELFYRFMEWFAHHLSNFEFRWKWTEWLDELDQSDLNPKKAFIIGALDIEIRLSFAKRIRETLPVQYAPLIPEGRDKDTPDFKYADDSTPYAEEGREILALLKKKASEDEIQTVMDKISAKAAEHNVQDVLVPCTDAYMTSVCYIGAKSISHVLSCIDRCKERLLAIGPQSEPARRQIISSVVDYWRDQPGVAVNIVDKLLNYTIITPVSVIEWALIDRLDRGRALARSLTYELVATTMAKVMNRVRQIVDVRAATDRADEQWQVLEETLQRERESMRELFNAVEDALVAVADGVNDEMIEGYNGESAEQDVVIAWGERWLRMWRREKAVEEAVVGEMALAEADAVALAEAEAAEAEAAEGAANGENGDAVVGGAE
ncbi:hypothetical protein LTR28_011858 [Elasticomyces elasticus]|nr:hypothetical protein LTR28_011858 [Elasticomyces elasticus]